VVVVVVVDLDGDGDLEVDATVDSAARVNGWRRSGTTTTIAMT